MDMENDETLQIFIEESLEHLSDIENDFLVIEDAGEDIDEDMVNKVYRAAHSIKGGAGFMGLTKIKDLTHELEDILGKIRSRDLIPNPEIINIMLNAADMTKELIENVATSNEADISEHVTALKSINEPATFYEEEQLADPEPAQAIAFDNVKDIIAKEKDDGKNVYQINLDLISDIHAKEKKLDEFISELEQTGVILDMMINIEMVGDLNRDCLPGKLPATLLFATIFKPEDVNLLFDIDENQIFKVDDDLVLTPILETTQPEPEISVLPESPKLNEPKIKPVLQLKKAEEIKNENLLQPAEPKQKIVEQPPAVKRKSAKKKSTPKISARTPEASLRVNVSILDSLMNLAGELVLGRNQLVQAIVSNDSHFMQAATQRIDLITSELQEAIMFTRMQPIGNVFNKFPRVVRDLSRSLGKEVELLLEGNEVELDKTILEAISDPLTHLVRNSVDHGIELPEDRRNAKKNTTGKIILKAYHEAGQVNIEIIDDGKGLDGNKLAEIAVTKGVITEEQSKIMSEKEKMHLIFMPGFSTAKEVTDVSGRGVGMDVVKTNLDKLGGIIDIDSHIGRGTTIKIKLPLTLAIIPSQIISTEGERYAIPQVNLLELLRIQASQVKDKIEKVGDAQVVRLRGELLPIVRLRDIISAGETYLDKKTGKMNNDRRENIADRRSENNPLFDEKAADDEKAVTADTGHFERSQKDRRISADSSMNIVVVSAGAMKYGLVVDKLLDSEEIVVKPLGRHLKRCKGYAGATIMGDGRVAFILDVAGIAKMADLTSMDGTDRAAQIREKTLKQKDDVLSLLIFKNAEDEQFCVPLNLVLRIEKIKKNDIEIIGKKRLIQYRGTNLPLVSIDDVADVKPLPDKEELLVIVFMVSGIEVGLLATTPLDAVDTTVQFDENILKQTGIMGTAIINNDTTMLVDIFGLLGSIYPEWFAETEALKKADGGTTTILYAEDSNFFRSQVKSFMEEAGYNILEAEDGMIGWDMLQEHGDEIDMVVTDVEMPNLDGIGFARKIREDARFSHLPIIALTTLAGDEEIKRGKDAGIDEYLIKLDKENLLQNMVKMLKAD